jgi:hypothetical protein
MARSSHRRPEAEIYVTKLEAARRQIDAAIRMYFAGEDSLAIHTIAAAGYKILRDLLNKRGMFDEDELLRVGIYLYAKGVADRKISMQELDKFVHSDHNFRPTILNIANNIKAITLFTEKDINIKAISLARKIEDWNNLSQAYNFLKHADRDFGAALRLKDVKNEDILYRAIGAYICLSTRRTNEMLIYWMFSVASEGLKEQHNDLSKESFMIIRMLIPLSNRQRRRTCQRLLRSWDRNDHSTRP